MLTIQFSCICLGFSINNVKTVWLDSSTGWWYRLWQNGDVPIWGECGGLLTATSDIDVTITMPITFAYDTYTLVYGIGAKGPTCTIIDRHLGINLGLTDNKTVSTFKTRLNASNFIKYYYACGTMVSE